jgi:hypothetical protein
MFPTKAQILRKYVAEDIEAADVLRRRHRVVSEESEESKGKIVVSMNIVYE